MKLSIIVVAVSLSACMMGQTQADSSKVFHSSGAFVSMWSPGAAGSQIWLYASHSDRPETATFLQFDIFTPHPDGSFTDTFGSGLVPEDALTGNTAKELTLHVDTSQVSSFQTTTCRSNGTCEPGPAGLVQFDFRADGDFSYRTIAEDRYDFFQVTQRSHYDYKSASALANGSILGISMSNGSSSIGTNRSTTITLTRKR